MNTSDFNIFVSSKILNENLYKKFGIRFDLENYTREQLEDARNKIRTRISQVEGTSKFNDLLTNENYQKDKFVLDMLNTRIKEMLGESRKLKEKAVSQAQQQAAGVALAAKRAGKKVPGKGAAAQMAKMSTAELEKFAGTKRKGLPKRKSAEESLDYDDESMDEVSYSAKAARAGKDIGKPGKQFAKIAKSAGERYGSKERGEKVAGSVLKKLRSKTKESQDAELDEKWGEPTKVSPAEKGKHSKKSVAQLKKELAAINKTGPHKRGSKEDARRKELQFAIRAKTGWGKVKEAVDQDGDGDNDFADVQIARMKKSGVDKKKAITMTKNKPYNKKGKKVKEHTHKEMALMITEGLKRYLREDEESKARTITSAADIVDDFTSWMQRLAQVQTKSMIELYDSIRADFGQATADQFKSVVSPALDQSLEALTSQRETITHAVAALAGEGEIPTPMGQDMSKTEPEEFPASPDSMQPPEDEFSASDAAAGGPEIAGRERRESKEFVFKKKLAEQHYIMKTLSQ